MTDDRDPDLARRLEELRTPDHRPGFWADLRADLSDSTHPHPGGGPDLVEIAAPPNSTELGPTGEPDLVEFGRPSPAWGRRVLSVAAAVVLLALVAVGVTRTGGDGETDVVTDPTPVEDPTTTGAPDGPLRADGDPVERGVGRPVAIDPTGTFLYVAAPSPDGGSGCEGAPAEALFVERVDGDGSDRRLAAAPEVVDATGLPLLAFSGTGEVAVVPRCEGAGARVITGTVAEDGTVVVQAELTVNHLDLTGPVDRITDIEFASPGVLVAATWSLTGDGTDHRHLYSFPTSPSELTDLGPDGAISVEVADDGRLSVLTADGDLHVDGDRRMAGLEPGATLAVGHGWIVLSSSNRTEVHDAEPGARRGVQVAPVGGWDAVVASSRTVVFTLLQGETASVVALDTGSRETTTLVEGAGAGLAVAPDASVVFAAVSSSDPAAPPRLLEQRLTR